MTNQTPITTVGMKMLQDELDKLIKVDREEVKKAIAEAREHGDLKENAEYHSAKEKQSHIEGRIAEIQGKIGLSKVIDVSKLKGQKIVFGATVSLYNIEKEESVTYQVVGEDEAKTAAHKISYTSPLGKALIGKEEGDEVIVKAPKGDITYEVEEIRFE